jgi:mono/diheme cytochrome c family protein
MRNFNPTRKRGSLNLDLPVFELAIHFDKVFPMTFRMTRLTPLACLAALTLLLAGCSKPAPPRFHLNVVGAVKARVSAPAQQQVANILEALYGSPDQPRLPPEVSFKEALITRAAGPVASDIHGRKVGLFREHCVHCHGISGDGMGPTAAFLNPYPRDYRMGTFKFKSTEGKEMPTDADLGKVLEEGIPGTSMPSFRMLAEEDRQALVEYVKYLSLRGQTELNMYDTVNDFLTIDEAAGTAKPDSLDKSKLSDMYAPFAGKWKDAAEKIVKPGAAPEDWDKDRKKYVDLGHKLYFDKASANCQQCHGTSALGDGQLTGFDDWTKLVNEAMIVADSEGNKARGADIALIKEFSLKPRNIIPRNLRSGIYRGGRRPIDLYYRIMAGINGSGMPAHNTLLKTEEERWAIVAYVLSLPYSAGGALAFEQEQLAPSRETN